MGNSTISWVEKSCSSYRTKFRNKWKNTFPRHRVLVTVGFAFLPPGKEVSSSPNKALQVIISYNISNVAFFNDSLEVAVNAVSVHLCRGQCYIT